MAKTTVFRSAGRLMKRHAKGILYYSAVTLVLGAIAFAAESYRAGEEYAQKLVLTDELAAEVVAESVGEPLYPEGMRNIRGFSQTPEWNPELGLWESHCANDYVFDGGEIPCLMGGVVTDVGESAARGGYIAIEGADGREYIYCSVQPKEEITVGAELKAGDLIACAGDSMANETAAGEHMHLEVYEGGMAVDFERLSSRNAQTVD